MSINEQAKRVISRGLDPARIKKRPGKGNKKFDYIPTEYAIELLNEAFDYEWSTRVVDSIRLDNDIVVLMELEVPTSVEGRTLIKQQYGTAESRSGGLSLAEAYKAAASDALKKCATFLGIALELYRDKDEAQREITSSRHSAGPTQVSKAPAFPKTAAAGRSGPQPAKPLPRPLPAPVSPPKSLGLQIDSGNQAKSLPRPTPFDSRNSPNRPNAIQLNALNNLASKKGMGEDELISLAGICDEAGYPKQLFENLSYDEAIQVIKAAQQ